MATPARKPQYTYQDYLLFPEDGNRHEIIGGEHYVSPAPKRWHQITVGNLYYYLRSYLDREPLGEILLSPFDVVLSDWDVVQPDLLFISRERSAITQENGAFGAPDLVIEVLSKSTRKRDETIKLGLYEAMGVIEYWIADPEAQTIQVYRSPNGRLGLVAELSAEDHLETPLLPGLSISVKQIFE
jgi:Uma2 family endonuclease